MTRALRTCCGVLLVCLLMCAGSARAQCSPVEDPASVSSDALPWRGSAFTLGQALGASTFSKSSTLSYDPYYAVTVDLCLQWHFARALKASIEQALNVELTDSNSTTSRQEPLLSDTSVRIDGRLYTQRFGQQRTLGWNGGLELLAPTSLASQAATMVAGTRVRFGPKLTLKDFLDGAIVSFEAAYLRRFSRDNTVRADEPYPCLLGTSTASECTHLAGSTNLRDAFHAKLSLAAYLTPKLGVEMVGALQWDRASSLAAISIPISSGSTMTLPDRSATHWRNSRSLVLGVFYSFYSFFDLELSTTSQFAERGPDGGLRGAFRTSDTVFGLDARFELDQLYTAASGGSAQHVTVEQR